MQAVLDGTHGNFKDSGQLFDIISPEIGTRSYDDGCHTSQGQTDRQERMLQQIEHDVRNSIQADLHDTVMTKYALLEKWNDVAACLGITKGTLGTMRKDDGTSFGPSLREAVLYYCGLDAAAGIRPLDGFDCLSAEDYERLNSLADYMVSVSGTGKFKGEEQT